MLRQVFFLTDASLDDALRDPCVDRVTSMCKLLLSLAKVTRTPVLWITRFRTDVHSFPRASAIGDLHSEDLAFMSSAIIVLRLALVSASVLLRPHRSYSIGDMYTACKSHICRLTRSPPLVVSSDAFSVHDPGAVANQVFV